MFLEKIASCFAIGCMTLLIILYVLVVGLILMLFIIFHKEIFRHITNISKECRIFIRDNSGFFLQCFFLLLFFFEQLILVIGILFFKVSIKLQAFIGAFALIVITTATIQKFVWEYKYIEAKDYLKFFKEQNKNFLLKLKNKLKELSES